LPQVLAPRPYGTFVYCGCLCSTSEVLQEELAEIDVDPVSIASSEASRDTSPPTGKTSWDSKRSGGGYGRESIRKLSTAEESIESAFDSEASTRDLAPSTRSPGGFGKAPTAEDGSFESDASGRDVAHAPYVEDEWAKLWVVQIPQRSSGSMRCSLVEEPPDVDDDDDDDRPEGGDEAITPSSSWQEEVAEQRASVAGRRSTVDSSVATPTPRSSLLVSPQRAALPSMGKVSFVQADAVPDIGAGDWREEPVFTEKMQGIQLDRLEAILRSEPFIMETCLKEDIQASEMQISKWQEGVNAPGTLIRSMKYRIPVPDDLPAAARTMVAVPEFCRCKTFVRLRCRPEELALTFQSISEGLPFGEYVRVQVTNTFTPFTDATGAGVTFRRWVVLAWVKELPWALRFLKRAVVSKIMQAGTDSSKVLLSLLRDRCAAASTAA